MMDAQQSVLEQIEKALIGLRYSEAINELNKAGWEHRLACADGQHCVLTRDYNESRVNLYLEQSRVIKITIG
jgi:hypothetical protein